MQRYRIAEAGSHAELVKIVNEQLKEGWVVTGSPYRFTTTLSSGYAQALIHNEQPSTERYTVVMATNQNVFEREVAEHLRNGWRLQGGVSAVVYTPDDRPHDMKEKITYQLTQAMVK